MKRRVLQIVDTLERGPAQRQLLLLAAGLQRDEFDIHVCALTDGPLAADFVRQSIPVTVIGKARRADLGIVWRLRRHIRNLGPDIVHTWDTAVNIYGRLAAMLAGSPMIIATKSNSDPSHSWLNGVAEFALDRRTDVIIVNSLAVIKPNSRLVASNKVQVIPFGIEPAEPSDCTRDAMLAELGLPRGARLIGSAGRLEWPERIKDLIWATDLLKVIRDDVHLLVVGVGSQRAALVRYARLCQIDERVHFLGKRHDLPSLAPHLDLFWLASGRESPSIGVMDAMAASVPVVVSDTAVNRELVIPNETGYLVPLGDRAGYARLANAILNDSALACRLGTAAKERIATNFTVRSMVDKHAAVYGGRRALSSGGATLPATP